MYIFAYLLLVASFLCAVFCAGAIIVNLSGNSQKNMLPWAEKAQFVLTVCMTVSMLILLYAFTICDFSVEYVVFNSDSSLPLFYRLTALWAGQAGSLLFWGWSVAISGVIFSCIPQYQRLTVKTRLWYWVFFLGIMAFFLLLLTGWSNPFVTLAVPQKDGFGLNPLLQNPGMIFHPPLLFLGYGGFVVPGCLALAQALTVNLAPDSQGNRKEPAWADTSRHFILVSWLLLTAGIILGAWWAYMELGWGGYWAWDPVENASLIPWLIASAYLHTGIIESRRGKLRAVNVFLIALTTISAFFATYLVRSGAIESLHAYPDGGVGKPLLIFVLTTLVLAIAISYFSPEESDPIESPTSKEGLLSVVAWLLLALSVIILIATLWPVIVAGAISLKGFLPASLAAMLPQKPMGLQADFYNKTCLPLFAALSVLLIFCPFKQWKKGWITPYSLGITLAGVILAGAFSWSLGVVEPLALAAAAASFGAIFGIIALFVVKPNLLQVKETLAAHAVHIGLLMMIAGVAFSGPYQTEHTLILSKDKPQAFIKSFAAPTKLLYSIFGKQTPLAGVYTVELENLYEGESRYSSNGVPHYQFLKARLHVFRDGQFIGTMEPQIRLYASNQNQPFKEVETIFSLSNEIYATLSHVDEQGRAHLNVNVNPLVNWLWVGGTIMSLAPLIGFFRKKKRPSLADEAVDREGTATA